MNALTFLKMFPTVVPSRHPRGTVSDTEPTIEWVRWSSTARPCSAGGSTVPVTPEMERALVFR